MLIHTFSFFMLAALGALNLMFSSQHSHLATTSRSNRSISL